MITTAQQHAQRNRGTLFVEDGELIATETYPGEQYIMRIRAPKCAATARPGTFVHVTCDDALPMYEQLTRELGESLETLLGRAECLFELGKDAEAMPLFARIAVTLGPSAEPYWLAELRMLQILDRVGRNTHRITPHIRMLQRNHPELGGEEYRREFERLLRRH